MAGTVSRAGDLIDRLQTLNFAVAAGLLLLIQRNRDVKPENVLLDRDLKPAKPRPYRSADSDPTAYRSDENRYRTEGQIAGAAKIKAEDA